MATFTSRIPATLASRSSRPTANRLPSGRSRTGHPDQDGIPPAFQPYLAFDAAGNLYASASNAGEIVMLNRNGEIISRIANAGAERLAQPLGVAVAPGGNVLITDAGRDAVFTYVPIPDVPASAATPVG